MLANALDSNSRIICFREIFNLMDLIQYDVAGYDNYDKADFALRAEDSVRFLRERIFCDYPPSIRAVGFKFHYSHHQTFAGVFNDLIEDRDLAVLHLRRRNELRTLVSLEIARETGKWIERRPTRSLLGNAIRTPVRAFRALREQGSAVLGQEKPRVRIRPKELYGFMVRSKLVQDNAVARFADHEILDVFYEEMVANPSAVFDEAQRFLGLHPVALRVETKRQNPEPLSLLIENYDELRDAFKGTNAEPFFED